MEKARYKFLIIILIIIICFIVTVREKDLFLLLSQEPAFTGLFV